MSIAQSLAACWVAGATKQGLCVGEGVARVDILVATPGRLMAHLRGTPGISLHHLHFLVGIPLMHRFYEQDSAGIQVANNCSNSSAAAQYTGRQLLHHTKFIQYYLLIAQLAPFFPQAGLLLQAG